jgi:diguanylate cyclase (GGDEF)-like protein
LIVDDSVPLHKLVKAHLEPDELETYSAYDGESALAMAATLRPSLILLDVDMPHLDGFEVGRRLRLNAVTASTPFIFLTANSIAEDKVKGLEIGACDYITKPFKPQELRARVRASLRTQRQIDDTAMIDAGTGIWSRTYMDLQLPGQLSQAKRQGRSLACIVTEVDQFSLVSTKQGAAVCNGILRTISRILLSHCRAEDIVCKFDADKFALLISGANRAAAAHMAERLRGEVQRQLGLRTETEVGITCSFGVADIRVNGEATLVDRADAAAHRASQTGNCVIVAREVEDEIHSAAPIPAVA